MNDHPDDVILHFADWNGLDKYYQVPPSIMCEFKKKLENDSRDDAWDWWTTQVDYDNDGSCPVKYQKVDMRFDTVFLDWEQIAEYMKEWDKEFVAIGIIILEPNANEKI